MVTSHETAPKRASLHMQAGMSLMEILLVIAIVAFLIVGGLTLFVQAQNQGQAQRAQQQLTNLSSSIRSLYSGSSSYAGLAIPVLYQSNAVPEDMRDPATTTIFNAFGGAVAVSPGGGAGCGGAGRDFCITFNSMTRSACQQLASARIGFSAVTIGSSGTELDPQVVTVAQIAAGCTNIENDTNGAVTWRFSG